MAGKLLDQIDSDVLQEAIRRRGSTSQSSTGPSTSGLAETVNSGADSSSLFGQKLAPSNSSDDNFCLSLSTTGHFTSEDFSSPLASTTSSLSLGGTSWDYQSVYMQDCDLNMGFSFPDEILLDDVQSSLLTTGLPSMMQSPPQIIVAPGVDTKFTISHLPIILVDEL